MGPVSTANLHSFVNTSQLFMFLFFSPCDGYYKRLYEEEKKKKEVSMKVRINRCQ